MINKNYLSKIKQVLKIFAFIMASSLLCQQQTVAQNFYTEFGKNRVQYHDFEWSFYESRNFVVYFYQGAKQLGQFTVLSAEENLPDIQNKLEYFMDKKVEILVYHNISDLNQTNIGNGYQTIDSNSGGSTRIINNKIFIYFDGNHQHLEAQIREGIARAYVANMLFGDNVQEVLQNAFLLNLPEWFREGLINYVGHGWNSELDSKLRDGILNDSFHDFTKLSREDAIFAGHSLWHYIAQNYNKSAIPNLLYLTRVNRSLESGFIYVLGQSLQTTIDEWLDYNNQLFAIDEKQRNSINVDEAIVQNKKENKQITDLAISNNGNHLAYVVNKNGKYKLFVKNLEEQKENLILKGGLATYEMPINTNYPLLSWSKKNSVLTAVYQKRDMLYLLTYSAVTNEFNTDEITKFEQVLEIASTNDPKTLIFSAVKNGQPDLFLYYTPTTKITPITNDFYDDLQPSYYEDSLRRGILFSSNRLDDTLRTEKLDTILPTENFDVFFYNLDDKTNVAHRLNHSQLANEWFAQQYNSEGWLSFTSDENGIYNQYLGQLDSSFVRTDKLVYFKDSTAITNPNDNIDSLQSLGKIDSIQLIKIYKPTITTYPISDFNRNIVNQDVSLKSSKTAQLFQVDNKQYVTINAPRDSLTGFRKHNLKPSPFKQQQVNRSGFKKPKKTVQDKNKLEKEALAQANKKAKEEKKERKKNQKNKNKIDTNNYFFESEFDNNDNESTDELEVVVEDLNQQKEEELKIEIVNTKLEKALKNKEPIFKPTKIRPYATKFSIEKVTAQFDNSALFAPYEKYGILPNQNQIGFNLPLAGNTELNTLNKYAISDLMEDYRIVGGFRFPMSFNGFEWFAEFQNFKKRLDKRFTYYRKGDLTIVVPDEGQYNGVTPFNAKIKDTYIQALFSYPFDFATSIKLHAGFRHEQTTIVSQTVQPLVNLAVINYPDISSSWAYTKLEYVYDDTRILTDNILQGTRYKVFTELHQPFSATINDREFDFNIPKNTLMGIAGFDARHYHKLYRNIIVAGRLYGATSYGNNRMMYRLGGVENWLNFALENGDIFDYTTPDDENQNYAFQNKIANLRGFKINVRNGNNVLLMNSEIRVPLVSTFFNRPLRSDLLNNFQIVPFFDMGMAWIGVNPFNPESPYIQNSVTNGTITVDVNYFRNPVVGGYGIGARTKLFGYFIKLDFAQGIDNGKNAGFMRYLSFGYDF